MWWTRWTRRKDAPIPDPPATPCPQELERARKAAQEAHQELEQVEAQTPAVEARAAKLEALRAENNIGPKFWKAVGERRPKRA